MVVQSGEDSTGRNDTKPVKTPSPWKYILIAAILSTSVLGIFFAATTGIFDSNPAPAAFTNPISGASQPATNPIVFTDNEDDNRITKTTKIPNPNEIMPYKTLIDISNPPQFIQTDCKDIILTNLKINNDKITAAYLNACPERSIRVRPIRIYFYDAQQHMIHRQQWVCQYSGYNGEISEYTPEYERTNAHCQWPDDYCDPTRKGKAWEKYWEKQNGKPMKTETVGSTIFNDAVPKIKSNEKFHFSINCPVPDETRYIKIM
jgi:hypothetical protein